MVLNYWVIFELTSWINHVNDVFLNFELVFFFPRKKKTQHLFTFCRRWMSTRDSVIRGFGWMDEAFSSKVFHTFRSPIKRLRRIDWASRRHNYKTDCAASSICRSGGCSVVRGNSDLLWKYCKFQPKFTTCCFISVIQITFKLFFTDRLLYDADIVEKTQT